MKNYIFVSNISKNFRKKDVLKNVSFTISKGSITGLIGPNGSGKTTMLRILNGVVRPNEGSLVIDGMDPFAENHRIQRKIGVVTDSSELYHELSAYENLSFFSDIYGIQNKERILMLLEQFDLLSVKNALVGTFSTGMKKRLSLCKALLHSPEILLLDEPTNGLDPEGIQLIIDCLEKMNKEEKITILICTHVLPQLEKICDSLVFIKNGEVLESGTKKELEEKYLSQIQVIIETTSHGKEEFSFESYTFDVLDDSHLSFTLGNMEEVPALVQRFSNEHLVYGVHIPNKNLESLYFAIGGEIHE